MRLLSGIVVVMLLCIIAFAKKPDWPGGGGNGVVGFGLVELTPEKKGDGFVPTDFTFEYQVDQKHTDWLDGGVVIVLPAEAAAKYNNIPKSEALKWDTAKLN